jgi:type VI secretion system protein ImpG
MGIVQLQLNPLQSPVTSAVKIPAGTALHSRPVDGPVCSFRTGYPVSLWPIRVVDAGAAPAGRFRGANLPSDGAAAIRIEFECVGGLPLAQVPVDTIRLYLKAGADTHTLYESLFLDALRVQVRALPAGEGAASAILPPSSLQPVGFGIDEGILPYTDRSFPGYRLLQEYFTFPEKFFFVDIMLGAMSRSGFGSRFEILIPLRERGSRERLIALEQIVDRTTFQLGCAPMINLFERDAEPIRLTQTKAEYRVNPDEHRQMATEVYSIHRVSSTVSYQQAPRVYEPFYAIRHGSRGDAQRQLWYAKRRESFRKERDEAATNQDKGTEVYLCLVDLDFNPAVPPVEMLTVRVTCTNRDKAAELPPDSELQPEGVGLAQARCIRKPTPTVRPPLRRSLQWRLISHLTLNHLSIVEGSKDALQEILRLYNFDEDPSVLKQIAGIREVSSRASVSRVPSKTGVTFCRGTEVTVGFDESEFTGTGVFLLASVLERFLALYSAVNSFTRLKAVTGKGVLKQWPPRAGEQMLL